jgi:hypothetical protein
MRRFGFPTLLLFLLALVSPALADVGIDSLLVRRKNGAVNVRVNLFNFGPGGAKGPFHLEILGRADANDSWQSMKVWTNIGKLAAGHKVSRDFFDPNSTVLARLSTLPFFEVKAVLSVAGSNTPVEMISPVEDQ